MTTKQEFYVKSEGGAYTTTTVRGCRASCTHSAQVAAAHMAEKLFGCALVRVEKVDDSNHFTTRWIAHAAAEEYASVGDDGLLDVSPTIPVSNTAVAKGPGPALIKVVGGLALFSPGPDPAHRFAEVPDMAQATSREEKDAVLLAWLRFCAKATRPKDSLGVVFETRIRRSELAGA